MGEQRSISWSARREGNDGYVLETYSDGETPQEFGPMPANNVPAFIEARRKLVAIRAEKMGFTKVSSDTTH